MSEIDNEAREIAVAWAECEDKDWIGQKHKLASDIMCYAKKHAIDHLREELIRFSEWINDTDQTPEELVDKYLKG
jgi:phage terminase Nu1 subunit (DNA packaging protein)